VATWALKDSKSERDRVIAAAETERLRGERDAARALSPTPSVLAAPDQAGIRSGRLTGGDIQADPTVEPSPPVTAAVVTAYFAD